MAQVVAGVGIEAGHGEALEELAFDFEAVARKVHQAGEARLEGLLAGGQRGVGSGGGGAVLGGQIADTRQVDCDDADRAGERVRAEEAAAALFEQRALSMRSRQHIERASSGFMSELMKLAKYGMP